MKRTDFKKVRASIIYFPFSKAARLTWIRRKGDYTYREVIAFASAVAYCYSAEAGRVVHADIRPIIHDGKWLWLVVPSGTVIAERNLKSGQFISEAQEPRGRMTLPRLRVWGLGDGDW